VPARTSTNSAETQTMTWKDGTVILHDSTFGLGVYFCQRVHGVYNLPTECQEMFDSLPSNRAYVTQRPHTLICVHSLNSFNRFGITHVKAETLYAA